MKHFIFVCEDCSDAGSEEGVNPEMYTINQRSFTPTTSGQTVMRLF
jgi:hypothetical protein